MVDAHDHEESCCAKSIAIDTTVPLREQRRNAALLFATLVGGALILNSFLAAWTYESHLAADDQLLTGFFGLIGAIFLSAPIVIRAGRSVWQGRLNIGELATMAIFACFAIGKYQEAGLVAFFLMLAELLEDRTAMGAKAAVEQLIRLTPSEAHQVIQGKEHDVPVRTLNQGDLIRVRPGENVPVDGLIRQGESTMNQASITGESLPVDKQAGDPVFAGTINLTGLLEIEVNKVGADTTLGKVRDLILAAEKTRLPIMRLVDQYVKWYTPMIIVVSILIFYFTKNIENAITALVVGCPCALVLATPTAMVAGLTSASRLGILIKNVNHLESASQITAVVFDKTGTLTTGDLTVVRMAPKKGLEAKQFLEWAASADRHSNHPAARALVRVAKDAHVTLLEPKEFHEVGGKGVLAVIDGRAVRVGRQSWLQEHNISMEGLDEPAHDEAEGYSYLYVSLDQECLGWIAMVDRPRKEALQATEELKKTGIRQLTMLTGDRWGVARRVAATLGCHDVVAECLPQQKLDLVEKMKKQGMNVAVIGDGVNDAPALAAGDLGIAMGAAGNDVAINSASIALLSNDIRRIPFMIRLSRRVRNVVGQNIILAVLFVVLGLIASGMGYLTPVIAALLHNVGSYFVIMNSARIVRFGEEF